MLLFSMFAIGIAVGALSGTLGVGGGFMMVPILVLVAGLEQHVAQGTSLLAILPISLLGAWSARRRGLVDVGRGLTLGTIGVIGSVVASQLAVHFVPGSALKYAFAALLALVAARMLFSSLVSRGRSGAGATDSPFPGERG